MSIINARIENVSLFHEDHGMLTAFLDLTWPGNGQGFGGYVLYSPGRPQDPSMAGWFIWRVMETVGVMQWEQLKGQFVRAQSDGGLLKAIGHITDEKWFSPKDEWEKYKSGLVL